LEDPHPEPDQLGAEHLPNRAEGGLASRVGPEERPRREHGGARDVANHPFPRGAEHGDRAAGQLEGAEDVRLEYGPPLVEVGVFDGQVRTADGGVVHEDAEVGWYDERSEIGDIELLDGDAPRSGGA